MDSWDVFWGTGGKALMVILLAVVTLLVFTLWILVRTLGKMRRLESGFEEENRRRLDRSRSVLLGQVTEHLVPLLPGFPYSLKDARFVGQPVDYLIFDGLEAGTGKSRSEIGPGGTKAVEVVFCEIKTGQSRLNAHETALKEAVDSGRVRFEVWRLKADGRLERES